MTLHWDDPTFEELLDDPLTQGLMRADRVDPAELAAMLRSVAGGLDGGRRLRQTGMRDPGLRRHATAAVRASARGATDEPRHGVAQRSLRSWFESLRCCGMD